MSKCPKCGSDELLVVGGRFETTGMAFNDGDFSFMDARNFSTYDEEIMCNDCGVEFLMDEIIR